MPKYIKCLPQVTNTFGILLNIPMNKNIWIGPYILTHLICCKYNSNNVINFHQTLILLYGVNTIGRFVII